jgi:uncharacterized protein (TIGR00369 family)
MTDQISRPDDPADSRPYYRLLGFRTDKHEVSGRSRLHLDGREELQNSRGDIHGGVVASLLDAAMGVAVRSGLMAGEGASTVSLTVNYLLPARGPLVANGRVTRAGRTLASVEADAQDSSGQIVAHAIGTLRIIARRDKGKEKA